MTGWACTVTAVLTAVTANIVRAIPITPVFLKFIAPSMVPLNMRGAPGARRPSLQNTKRASLPRPVTGYRDGMAADL